MTTRSREMKSGIGWENLQQSRCSTLKAVLLDYEWPSSLDVTLALREPHYTGRYTQISCRTATTLTFSVYYSIAWYCRNQSHPKQHQLALSMSSRA